ncbi:MAG: FAD binding domain-containing protein [Eubacteriales bacterium]|nr:FAD binding domain-containing protein [Ruminiclostridium sp.]MDD4422815.1 FAD binding domain-containing protein [Eubacteriales bacterium]
MISFDFEYYRPDTLNEAVESFRSFEAANKTALYYSGGTEILSMARAESLKFDAVIDLKSIPECGIQICVNGQLLLGSALTLTQIAEAGHYPLLCETVSRIADHTIQDKITLGGNLAGTIKYREAALPLLVKDCKARIMAENGLQDVMFSEIFKGRLQLKKGEFLVQIIIDEQMLNLPYAHIKKTKMDKIDYLLITIAASKNNSEIKAAVSGIGDAPFLLLHDLLSNNNIPESERIANVLESVRPVIIGDILGSKDYRLFVLGNILSQMYENWR